MSARAGPRLPSTFEAVTLAGLAPDGGLYVPDALAGDDARPRSRVAGLNYVETAVRVCTPFVGDALTEDELRALLTTAYRRSATPRSRR